jgi:hypothetical protein
MATYDSDDALSRSPLLEPQTISYKPVESPPPFLPDDSSSSSLEASSPPAGGPGKKSSKKRRKKTQPSLGDTVLISYLDPNRPDIAKLAGEETINSASQSEAEGSGDEEMGDPPNQPASDQVSNAPNTLAKIAQETLEKCDPPVTSHQERSRVPELAEVNGLNNSHVKKESSEVIDSKESDALDVLKGLSQGSPDGRRTPKLKTTPEEEKPGEDSLATSPNIGRFTIPASEASPMQTLPAIQKSPPRSASASSPGGTQSLPSLQTALAEQDVQMNGTSPVARATYPLPLSGQSPPLNRGDRQIQAHFPPPQPHAPPPYAQLSPQSGKEMQGMSPPGSTHPQLFRSSKPDTPFTPSTVSDQQPTPQSEGSNAYPTPIEHRMSIDTERPPHLNGAPIANGPFSPTGFKCNYPGCTAAPFQTQYLLK